MGKQYSMVIAARNLFDSVGDEAYEGYLCLKDHVIVKVGTGKPEQKILDEAKQEAARIIARANIEAELEKQKAADEVKQQIIAVSQLMAAKVVAASINEADSQRLIEQTLNEMGENTWLS